MGKRDRSTAAIALDRGEDHRVNGQLEAAELAYFEAACEAADSATEGADAARHIVMRARIGLGRIELARGSPERAFGWFLRARDTAPDDWEPLYWQGCSQGRLADYQGANKSFTTALRHNPRESSIAIQRSYVRFKMGDLATALDDLLTVQAQSGLDDAAMLTLVSLRLERKEWAEGERTLRTLLDIDPSNVRANELMGAVLEWQSRWEEAIDWYGRAVTLGEVSTLTCGRLGILHARAGRPAAALEWLQRARLTKSPDDGVLYYSGWTSFQLGDFPTSIVDWETLTRRHSGRQLGHLPGTAKHELARERIAARDYDAALPLLADCVSSGIGGQGAIRALAEVRLRIAVQLLVDRRQEGRDAAQAEDHLRIAGVLSSDDYRFPFVLALTEWADGNLSTALPLLRRACDRAGVSRSARLTVLRCALEAGDGITAAEELLRVADRPGEHVRRLARWLGAGRWSEAADLLLAGDDPDLPAELVGHCLVLANRTQELDLSSQRGARAGLLHGLASAAQGHLDEARSMLGALVQAHPDLAAARAGLSHVERLLAIHAVEAGSWQAAAGLLTSSSPADRRLAPAPLLEGLILLAGGRSRQADTYLEEALRRDPTNKQVLHTISARWLNGGNESVAVSTGIAATAALMIDEDFWARFQSNAASRYQAAVPAAALAECRRHIERAAYAQAGPSDGLLLLREMAAAGVLRDVGGFPFGDDTVLVCGPLMISHVGLERAWGEFIAQGSAHDESRSGQWRQLRQLFSVLGVATALLGAGRPEEALAALEVLACERCRSTTAPEGYPKVCAAACPDFDARHPSYVHLPGTDQRLTEDAARLLISAQLAVARRVVTSDSADVGAAITLWAKAIKTSAIVGTPEQTERDIADTALGRAKALERAKRLSAAITLVEAAHQALSDSTAREELRSQLGHLLCERGINTANDGRLEPALGDLRRAAQYSPHSPRPLVNLSLALQQLAGQQRDLGDRAGEYDSLREANRMLERAAAELSGSPQFDQQQLSVQKELRTVCNRWALDLAGAKRYDEALDVLDRGLVELPDDAELRKSQRTIQPYATPQRDRGRAGP